MTQNRIALVLKKTFLPLVVALFPVIFSISLHAQSFQWVRQFGSNPELNRDDNANAVVVFGDRVAVAGQTIGVFAGQTNPNLNDVDAFVALYDRLGNQIWLRQFGVTGRGEDVAAGVAMNESGIYVVGWTQATLPLQTSSGGWDAWIRKYDFNGLELWTRQFGTDATDEALAVAANELGVYVVGYVDCCGAAFPGFTPGGTDAFVRKYDSNGNVLWTRQFGTVDIERATAVAIFGEGIYVGGISAGELAPGRVGGRDPFLRRYDANGNVIWTRQFGARLGDVTNIAEDVNAVAAGPSGIYMAGAVAQGSFPGQTHSGGLWDAYVTKFDANGAQQWIREFGSDATGDDDAYAVTVGASGVLVGGDTGGAFPGQTYTSNGDAFIRLYDFDGNHLGTREFGSSGGSVDWVAGASSDASGFYIAGGGNPGFPGLTPQGGKDVFVAKVLPPPVVPDRAVVNAASFATNAANLPAPPLAPGSIAVIFGSYLNDGSFSLTTSIGDDGKLITSLAGTQVRVNNVLAPLFYSTPGQVAIQIPFEIAGQTSASLVVSVAGQSSAPRTINIAPTAPGFFTLNQAGTGAAVVLHSDGVTPVTAGNPARLNEVVIFYLTGLGALSLPLETGALAGGNPAAAPATLTFGGAGGTGISATVDYAGAAPGFAGLNQVNVRIPGNAPTGGAVSVALSIGGRLSNQVTIPIAQ